MLHEPAHMRRIIRFLSPPRPLALLLLVVFAACCLLLAGVLCALPARAGDGIEFVDAALQSTEEGYILSSNFSLDLTHPLEDALMRGIPLYFKLQLEVSRPRWYWFDEKTTVRRMQTRLSYHALTRQYRLSTGLLQQNFNSLSEALAVLRRVRNWPVLERGANLPEGNYQAAVRLRLDLSLLPKPFQVSALTTPELHLDSDWKRFSYKAITQPAVPPSTGIPPSSPGANLPYVTPALAPVQSNSNERRDEAPAR